MVNDDDYNSKVRRLFDEAVDTMTVMVMKQVPPELFMPFEELHRIVFAELEAMYFGFEALKEDHPKGDPIERQDLRPYHPYFKVVMADFLETHINLHMQLRHSDAKRIKQLRYDQIAKPGHYVKMGQELPTVGSSTTGNIDQKKIK